MIRFAKIFEVYDQVAAETVQILVWWEFDKSSGYYLLYFRSELEGGRISAAWKFNTRDEVVESLESFDQSKAEEYYYPMKKFRQ